VTTDYVTIVSGMPRSGTSLMMRMLDRGGIPALTDGRRPPDPHNPYGYYEDERARRLAQDAAWLNEARGKAVKIIYRLLPHIPQDFDCRILFMERDIEEIYDSQQKMLETASHPAANQDRQSLIQALAKDLELTRTRLAAHPCLFIPYPRLIATPETWLPKLTNFLQSDLDTEAMRQAIDPTLYRNRRA
jgi:hypothetical protein